MVIACARVAKVRPPHQCRMPSKHVRTAPCRWMSPNTADWCFGGKVGAFNAEFLILWGARWGPAMRKVRHLLAFIRFALLLKPVSAGHASDRSCHKLRLPCSWPRPESSLNKAARPSRRLPSAGSHRPWSTRTSCTCFQTACSSPGWPPRWSASMAPGASRSFSFCRP